MIITIRDDNGETVTILAETFAAQLNALNLDTAPQNFEEWCYVVDRALSATMLDKDL